jgi:hypothetical protein
LLLAAALAEHNKTARTGNLEAAVLAVTFPHQQPLQKARGLV